MENVKPKIVTLDIFDTVENIKLTDYVKYYCDDILEMYANYLKELKYLQDNEQLTKKERDAFLTSLKEMDIINNQVTENENPNLILIYRNLDKKPTIDELIKKGNTPLTSEEIKKYHRQLIKDTSSDKGKIEYVRNNNNFFVGTYNANRTKNIEYMPIDYKNIDEALNLLVEYYNQKISEPNDILIKPFLFHALVACLQIFNDGNTRIARLLQHIKIWNYTNEYNGLLLPEKDKITLEKPALYLTEPYRQTRGQYREIIKNLVISGTLEDWNKWFDFNLMRTEETLNMQTNVLKEFKEQEVKRRRRSRGN